MISIKSFIAISILSIFFLSLDGFILKVHPEGRGKVRVRK
jgi:hypothetical protein